MFNIGMVPNTHQMKIGILQSRYDGIYAVFQGFERNSPLTHSLN